MASLEGWSSTIELHPQGRSEPAPSHSVPAPQQPSAARNTRAGKDRGARSVHYCMSADQDITDSPEGWVAEHTQQYVESGGEQGHVWNGVLTLLLTTTGRKSGTRRRTALIYGQDGEDFVVVASKGGAPDHPSWYLNLQTDTQVEVQVGNEVFDAEARTAEGDDKTRLWHLMTQIWPAYDEYQTKTRRPIPVVVLRRRG